MTVLIGSAPDFIPVRIELDDFYNDEAIKTFLLDGATGDTVGQEILEDINALTNAEVLRADYGGRKVTGMNNAAVNAPFIRTEDVAVLTFEKTNPVNTAKMVKKSFVIPAPVQAIINTDKKLIVGTSGTGSAPARLSRLITNLETALNYLGSDGTYYPGSWTFSTAESGLA